MTGGSLKRAFSIVEIVVILVVTGVISIAAYNTFAGTKTSTLNNQALTVLSGVAAAQEHEHRTLGAYTSDLAKLEALDIGVEFTNNESSERSTVSVGVSPDGWLGLALAVPEGGTCVSWKQGPAEPGMEIVTETFELGSKSCSGLGIL